MTSGYGIGYWGVYKRRMRRAAEFAKAVEAGTAHRRIPEFISTPDGAPVWAGAAISQHRSNPTATDIAKARVYTDPRVAENIRTTYTPRMAHQKDLYAVGACGLPAPVPAGSGYGSRFSAGFPRWDEPLPHRTWAENDDTAWAARARYSQTLSREAGKPKMRYSTGHPISQQDARAMQHVLREHGYSAGKSHVPYNPYTGPISMTNQPWIGEDVWGAWARNRRQNFHDQNKAQEQRRWGRNWGGGYGVGYFQTDVYPHGLCRNGQFFSSEYLAQAGGPWRVQRDRRNWTYSPTLRHRC